MKINFCFILIIAMVMLTVSLKAQEQPQFDLEVTNLKLSDTLDGKNNVLEFDIIMVHTNSIVTGPMKYFSGQFFLDFNPDVSNGGKLSYTRIGTDLPSGLEQGPASINDNQLRITANIPYTPVPVINTSSGGTLIARMRLATTASSFSEVPFDIKWRTSESGNPFTKISAFVNGFATDISKMGNYVVQSAIVRN